VHISVFDLDHTLVTGNSSYGFCAFLHKQKALSSLALIKAYWYRLRHDFSSAELERLHNQLFNCLLRGLSMESLERCAAAFIQNYIFPHLYFPTFQELRFAQHRGDYTVIMSSSPSFIVRRVAEALGVDEWLATEYRVDASNRLIEVHQFIDGRAKAKALTGVVEERGLSLKQVTAYSDSYRDLPFLSLAGEPVAVNPDAKLQAYSRENQWRIL